LMRTPQCRFLSLGDFRAPTSLNSAKLEKEVAGNRRQ
jgi:hypothetical protein